MRYMDQPVHAYLAQLAVIQQHDTTARLGQLGVPALVLAGEQDILIPVALSRQLAGPGPRRAVGDHQGRPRLPLGAPGRIQPDLPRIHQATRKGLAMADSPQTLRRGQLGLFGVIMPGLAQVAPAFKLFFTTGVMVALAGARPRH